jgi:hypothetical protein
MYESQTSEFVKSTNPDTKSTVREPFELIFDSKGYEPIQPLSN